MLVCLCACVCECVHVCVYVHAWAERVCHCVSMHACDMTVSLCFCFCVDVCETCMLTQIMI